MSQYTIGIDLGGTFIKAAVIRRDGKMLGNVSVPSDVPGGHSVIIANIAHASELARRNAGINWSRISGIGLAYPGTYDSKRGVISKAPNIHCIQGKPMVQPLRAALGKPKIPVIMENDANLAAYAELVAGLGRKVNSLLLLTLGTGVGGGIILNREIWRGVSGAAGEIGHLNLFIDGAPCGCGGHGCIEAYCSATGLTRRFREAIASGIRSQLADKLLKNGVITAEEIAQSALAGDKLCGQLIEETGRWLGVGVTSLLHIFNVSLIVFAGGMTACGNLLLDPIRDEAGKRVMPLFKKGLAIRFSRLGNNAGVLGAGAWALHVLNKKKAT